GAGPGDPGLLTLRGRELIAQADVVVYAGSLVNPEVLAHARPDAKRIDSAPLNLEQIVGAMSEAAHAGKRVVRVHSGDPSMYGAIAEQMQLLEQEEIPFEVVPGVSSAFAAAAALKMEYTLPGTTQTLILTRRSGRTPVPERESIALLAAHRASMAIFLSIGMVEETAAELLEGGYPRETPAAVVYRASWPEQKCIVATLATIAGQVRQAGITRQALILVGEAVGRSPAEKSKLYDAGFAHGFRVIPGMKKNGIAVVALTRRGWHTGRKIVQALDDAALYLPSRFAGEEQGAGTYFYEDFRPEVERLFYRYGSLVLIMAAGIAVRILAPLMQSKWEDPAVVTLDDSGRNVVSLLSGHWGGANDLAQKIAQVLGGNPVVTTESDVMGFPAVDLLVKALTGGRVPEQKAALKHIQSAILDDRDVGFFPKELALFEGMQGHPNLHFFDSVDELFASPCSAGLIVTPAAMPLVDANEKMLVVHPRNLVVGIGCHKRTGEDELAEGIWEAFEDTGLCRESLALLCSADRKKDDPGLAACALRLDVPLQFFGSEEINKTASVSPDSQHALRELGVRGVAEPCALLGAGGGRLLLPKRKLKNMTIAVAALPLRNLLQEGAEK
ncbi:precorrin-4 C(11)-methyltransferase, partial [Thermodesulfobacteriota bacterium]